MRQLRLASKSVSVCERISQQCFSVAHVKCDKHALGSNFAFAVDDCNCIFMQATFLMP